MDSNGNEAQSCKQIVESASIHTQYLQQATSSETSIENIKFEQIFIGYPGNCFKGWAARDTSCEFYSPGPDNFKSNGFGFEVNTTQMFVQEFCILLRLWNETIHIEKFITIQVGNPSQASITPSSPQVNQTVTIGDQKMYFMIPEFSYKDSMVPSCSLNYFVGTADNAFQLPVGLQEQTGQEPSNQIFAEGGILRVFPKDIQKEATYQFYLYADDGCGAKVQGALGPCFLIVRAPEKDKPQGVDLKLVNLPPFFDQVPEKLEFTKQQSEPIFELQLPDILDGHSNFESINITSTSLGSTFVSKSSGTSKVGSFIDYDMERNQISLDLSQGFEPGELDQEEIQIVIKDSYEDKKEYVFEVEFIGEIPLKIKEIPEKIWVPMDESPQEIEKVDVDPIPESDESKASIQIDTITNLGIFEIGLSDELFVPDQAQELFKENGNWSHYLNESVIKISIDPYIDQDDEDNYRNLSALSLNWTLTDINRKALVFALDIEDPLQVSSGPIIDELVFEIKDPEINLPKFFNFKNIDEILSKKYAQLRNKIGPQAPRTATTKSISAISETSEAFLQCSLIFSLLMSFMKTKVYGELLSTLRVLSFIVHLTLVGVFLPALAEGIFMTFKQIATYDMLEADGVIEEVIKFDEDKDVDPVPPIFESVGYETRNTFTNMATVGVFLLGFVIQFMLLPAYFFLNRQQLVTRQAFQEKVRNLFFKETMPFFIEGYFEFVLITALCYKYSSLSTFGEVLSTILVVLGFLITVGVAIFSVWVMFQDREYLLSDDFVEKYGDVLENIKIDSGTFNKGHLAAFPIFVFRRLIFVMLCFIDSVKTCQKIQIVMLMNIFIIIYHASYRPEKRNQQNNMTIFNEFMIQLSTLHMVLFSGAITKAQGIFYASITFSLVFLLFIVPNILLAVFQIARKVYACLKGESFRYKYKKYILRPEKQEISIQTEEVKVPVQTQLDKPAIEPKKETKVSKKNPTKINAKTKSKTPRKITQKTPEKTSKLTQIQKLHQRQQTLRQQISQLRQAIQIPKDSLLYKLQRQQPQKDLPPPRVTQHTVQKQREQRKKTIISIYGQSKKVIGGQQKSAYRQPVMTKITEVSEQDKDYRSKLDKRIKDRDVKIKEMIKKGLGKNINLEEYGYGKVEVKVKKKVNSNSKSKVKEKVQRKGKE